MGIQGRAVRYIEQGYFPFVSQKWQCGRDKDGSVLLRARDTARLIDGLFVIPLWIIFVAYLVTLVFGVPWSAPSVGGAIAPVAFLAWLLGLRCELRISNSGFTYSRLWYGLKTFDISFPLDTKLEVYDPWEDKPPAGIKFEIDDKTSIILGSPADYEDLLGNIRSAAESQQRRGAPDQERATHDDA